MRLHPLIMGAATISYYKTEFIKSVCKVCGEPLALSVRRLQKLSVSLWFSITLQLYLKLVNTLQ